MLPNNKRHILLAGEITVESATDIIANLLDFDSDSDEPISLFLNSEGGVINSGYSIIDVIRGIQSPVLAIGLGYVASMATSVIALNQKGHRLAYPHTIFMIHCPWTKVTGNSDKMKIDVKHLIKTERDMINELAVATGQTREQIKKDFDLERTFTAKEAKKYGLIDHII